MTEEWRVIAWTGGRYEVSSLGRVRRTRRSGRWPPGRVLKSRRKNGYHEYALIVAGGRRCYRLAHILVLEAFVGPRFKGCEGSHVNGDRSDNRVENLLWETRLENNRRKHEHGTMCRGESHGRCKVRDDCVAEIRALWATGAYTQRELWTRFGVSRTQLQRFIRGVRS